MKILYFQHTLLHTSITLETRRRHPGEAPPSPGVSTLPDDDVSTASNLPTVLAKQIINTSNQVIQTSSSLTNYHDIILLPVSGPSPRTQPIPAQSPDPSLEPSPTSLHQPFQPPPTKPRAQSPKLKPLLRGGQKIHIFW